MDKKIRVLHIGLDVNLGGIETYLLKISSYIDRSRFSFSFLAYDNVKPCFYEELTNLGCRFYFVRSRRASYFGNIRDLRNLFKREKFDIVHVHLNSLTYITPIIEALKEGCCVIAHSHNAGSASGSSSRVLCLINKYRFPYDKVTLVAVSDKAGEWMFGKHNAIVLNNGLDTSAYRYSEEKRIQLRKEIKLENKTIVIHVGAFRKQKNHKRVIEIFEAYHKRNKESVLLLVGTGELMDEMKTFVSVKNLENAVYFLSRRRDIDALLSASDYFLFPSFYEGFPNALIEAEASGLKCVVSDTITKEAALDNVVQLSLDDSDEVWCDALSGASLDLREKYADYVEEKGFGIKNEMKRLEDIYTSLWEKRNG